MDDEYGRPRDVCILGINQIRDAIGQPNVEFKSPGGRALEHAKFVDLKVESGKQDGYHDSKYTSDGSKKRWIQTGKEVQWKILKGKAGIHEGASGSYMFSFITGTGNFHLDTVVAGVQHGIIEQAGAWLILPNPNDPSKALLKCNGKDAFVQALAEDDARCFAEGSVDSLMNHIRTEVFKKNGIYINYEWE
jgi:hypothetical protein